MVRIHLICTLALLYTILTQMLSTEGRVIKTSAIKTAPQKTSISISQSVKHEHIFPSSKTTDIIPKKSFKVSSSCVHKVESIGQGGIPNLKSPANNRLKAPGYSNVHPGHAKKDSNKPNIFIPSRSLTSSSFTSAFAMVHESDFRPTTPGTSPGAGHAGRNKNDIEESTHCLNDKCTEGFQPTAPGDSPGAGHSFVNDDSKALEQAKRHGVTHTQAGHTDDNRPTAPGQSPGAGHPVSKEMIKPNS
ncbi:hypothetical protein RND81_11G220000 [Saponaria officinalis]|uniref:Uncharacterized protein n=1 Tax=Saponaria officinalis TaxID=3572 RepID=A0AAW1HQN9_SAPOF